MSNEVLSQDEVDALLKGVSDDALPQAPLEAEEGILPYNLARQERLVRVRMPVLESVNERFARLLCAGLTAFMRKRPEIKIAPVKVCKSSEVMRELVMPATLNVVQAFPLRGNALVIFDPTLVATVIDNMFGGDSRFQTRIEGRDFTPTEQRIIARLLAVTLENYNTAWQPVHPMAFEFVRAEMQAQFASIASPSEMVVTTSVSVEYDSAGGDIQIVIPYATLEPIRDVLTKNGQSATNAPDARWSYLLKSGVQEAEVELTAQLAHAQITLSQVLAMRRGDVIGMDIRPTLVADVDAVPIFECRYGVLNGQYAIRVEKILATSQNDQSMGNDNVG